MFRFLFGLQQISFSTNIEVGREWCFQYTNIMGYIANGGNLRVVQLTSWYSFYAKKKKCWLIQGNVFRHCAKWAKVQQMFGSSGNVNKWSQQQYISLMLGNHLRRTLHAKIRLCCRITNSQLAKLQNQKHTK